MSVFAIQYAFADYLTAVDRALDGDYGPMLALTEAISALPPPDPLGGGARGRSWWRATSTARRSTSTTSSRNEQPSSTEGWPSCPTTRSGGSPSRAGSTPRWNRSTSASSTPTGVLVQAAPPYDGPFPNVPVLMLNGDIDLQTPLEMAEQAKTDWPNSVFLTIKDAPRHREDERVRAAHAQTGTLPAVLADTSD